MDETNQTPQAFLTISIYWAHTKKYWPKLLIIYPLMTFAQLLEDFAAPIIISWILTNLSKGNVQAIHDVGLLPIFLAIIFIEIFSNAIWNLIVRTFWKTQDKIMQDIFMSCFDHLQTLNRNFFANRFAGSLVSQVNKFSSAFERLTDALTWNVFKLLVSVIATTIIIGARAPMIAVAILAVTAIYVPLVWHYRKKQLPLNQKWAAAESKRTGQLSDTISNINAVKSFANEKLERKMMFQRATDVYEQSVKTMRMSMNQEFITGNVQRSVNIAVMLISIYLAVEQKIDIGTIYLALTFTIGILRRLWDLNNTFRTFTRVFGDAHDMTQIFKIKPEIIDTAGAKNLDIVGGAISLRNVTFNHNNDGNDGLFNKLNLDIKPGEKVGLVGHSGSGKTTLTNLLLRFMEVDEGEILIDGQDISKITQKSLRNAIAYVPQEPVLFHRSLRENIAYGDPNASEEQIIQASKQANSHEFIEQLKDGYSTLVGERGIKLSGGQRQRIAIARAMIKKSPILVLDEATSALDSESESLIQTALWRLMQDKTAIVIAHRLSTVQKLDKIIVLDKGRIIEHGSHSELISKKGHYAKLWAHQSGGFLED